MQSQTTVTAEQRRIYDDFACYPWESDTVFQAGLDNILQNLPQEGNDALLIPQDDSEQARKELRLLQAKHFYYTRFKQEFSLAGFLDYQRNASQLTQAPKDQNEDLFQRVEKYAYDDDPKYMSGLPTIINGWVERQLAEKTSSSWDKNKLDEEFAKAKAFYYSSSIEPIKIADYLRWRKRKDEEAQPACPFANLWKNKRKAGSDAQLSPNNVAAKRAFVVVERPKTFGPQTLTLCSPKTSNVLTSARIEELEDAIAAADKENNITSSLLTVTVAENNEQQQQQTNENVIQTKDTKILMSGIAYSATVAQLDEDKKEEEKDPSSHAAAVQHSLNKLAAGYFGLVRQLLFQRTKPVVTFLNGAVPMDSAYLAFWHKFVRVATENTLLTLGINLSHAPVPPLLLLTLCRARKPLPNGLELYLALAPPSLARLRGPELLRLGLVDAFVPETKLNDMFNDCQRMALCPLPNTELAVRMTLAADHTYPGPDRLGVWENEIDKVFGNVDTFDQVVERLEKMDNRWSKDILSHWRTLPPRLLKTVFQAVKDSFDATPQKMLELEESLNQKWRSSQDYQLWRDGERSWEGAGVLLDRSGDLETYYSEIVPSLADDDNDSTTVFVYKVETEQEETEEQNAAAVAVCPVTGQKGALAGCPVSGQKGTAGSQCPVTGKTDSVPNRCPATGQQSVDSKCPVTGST